MIVMKFGGTSVGEPGAIRQVVQIVQQHAARRPLVVVSAHAGVTDQLLALARTAATGEADTTAIANRHRTILAGLSLPHDLLDRSTLCSPNSTTSPAAYAWRAKRAQRRST